MLIDAFPGFNEVELAKFRIDYLWNSVDRFIIAESILTHSGLKKPLYFSRWLETNSFYRSKVSILIVELDDSKTAWEREIRQREKLAKYLIEKFPKSRFIFSDLDEIPSLEQVNEFLEKDVECKFPTPVYTRYANFKIITQRVWSRGVMGDQKTLSRPNGARFEDLKKLETKHFGIHLSSLNIRSERIFEKLQSFAHEEFDIKELKSKEVLDFADLFAVDHLGRFDSFGNGLLSVESPEQFTGIQRRIWEEHPNWFLLSTDRKSHTQRVFASFLLSVITKSRLRRYVHKLIVKDLKLKPSEYILASGILVFHFSLHILRLCKRKIVSLKN